MTLLQALQEVLAGEHAAVYAYGLVGAQLGGTREEPAARQAYALHQNRRDRVAELVVAAGGTPVGPLAGYDVGGPVTTPAEARALAATVEARLAGPYADLVTVATGEVRAAASGWLVDAAVRSVRWGGTPVAFPGLAERR
ncbi:MAG TPA: ferritin-like domain-containing protein [Actinomycetes bacterium]|nr:ferritin-like domain-containing protein [Actinomycetes bacterium]